MKKIFSVLLVLMMTLGLCSALAEQDALPPYTNPYGDEEPVLRAMIDYMLETDFGFEAGEGGVLIPTPIVLKTEMSEDGTQATIWGNFWIFVYVRSGRILERTACGENPGVMKLALADGVWTVTSLEVAGDGDAYEADIEKFAAGDKELEAEYAMTTGKTDESFLPQYQRAAVVLYVEANALDIEAYRNPGWEPVSVID